jgi:branched-subunit amino acid transport protein AzlD
MTAIQAFGRGWAATSRSKAALSILWLFYALVALIVAAPAASMALQPLTHSRMAGRLLDSFDVAWLYEMHEPLGTAAAGLAQGAIVAALFTWLGTILLAGGVLTMLSECWDCFRFGPFLAGAGRHFWRLFRLSLLGLIGYGLAALAGSAPSMIATAIWKDGMEAWPMGVAGIAGSVLTVLLLGWMATALDYAKVRLVADDMRGSVMGLLRSFAFVFKHFGKTMGVWLMNAMVFVIVLALYLAASNAMHPTAAGTILLLVLLQQIFILFRTAQRVAVWDSALEIYQALKPGPAAAIAIQSSAEVPAPEPVLPVEMPVEHGDLPAQTPTEQAILPAETSMEHGDLAAQTLVEHVVLPAETPREAPESGGSGV